MVYSYSTHCTCTFLSENDNALNVSIRRYANKSDFDYAITTLQEYNSKKGELLKC